MAMLLLLYALCAFSSVFFICKSTSTTVEVTVPIHPIIKEGILPIQCQIRNIQDDYTVEIFRDKNGRTEKLTSGITHLPSVLEQRVFITQRSMPGGIVVYFMTITDVSLLDGGKYLCKVYQLANGESVKVAEGVANVEVYVLPNKIYPQCSSTPTVVNNMEEDIPFKLSCTSSKATPPISLRWIDNHNKEVLSRRLSSEDTVTSEIDERTSKSSHGSIFICEMTSSGFPDVIRSCRIGPITIKEPVKTITESSKPLAPTQIPNQIGTISSYECNSECPNGHKYMILYLSVATIGASLICVVFLITTIIMCCKYQSISRNEIYGDIRRRNVTIGDGSEPVYVSMQAQPEQAQPPAYFDRRPLYKERERSTGYMSVEDPNNPGNKILMPKEAFEKFYNSWSLKKKRSDPNMSVVGV